MTRRLVVVIVGAVVLAGLLAGCGGKTVTYDQFHTNIAAKPGDQFMLQFDTSGQPGFQWGLAHSVNPGTVKKVKSAFIKNAGTGGVEEWTFQAIKPGTAVIIMGYSKVTDKNALPTNTVTFNVLVQ